MHEKEEKVALKTPRNAGGFGGLKSLEDQTLPSLLPGTDGREKLDISLPHSLVGLVYTLLTRTLLPTNLR
jgi:hypothetical protein